MEYHIEYVPTVKVTADTARRLWLRSNGSGYLYFWSIPFLTLLLCLGSSELTTSRTGNLFIGVLLGVVVTFGVQFLYSLLRFEQSTRQVLRLRGGESIHLYLDEEGVSGESKGMTESYKWRNFNTLWQMPSCWLLFYSGTQYISFPLEAVGEEEKEFVVRKITEAGGRITR